MIRYELGDLEAQMAEARRETLALLEPISADDRHFDSLSERQDLADLLIDLTLWHAMVNKGLREIKRSKKPTQLINSIKNGNKIDAKERARFSAENLDDILLQLENYLFQQEEVLRDFSFPELNERNQYRFFRNVRLGNFIADITYEHERNLASAIELAVKGL